MLHSFRSSSVSATSSVYEFVEEYGRTFHSYKAGSKCTLTVRAYHKFAQELTHSEYILPNDIVRSDWYYLSVLRGSDLLTTHSRSENV
jgi:hypothetical protein